MRWVLRFLPLLLLARTGVARAVDLHSLFDTECRRQTGILLHVDDAQVALIGLDGRLARVPRAQVRAVVLHKLLESPLGEIDVDPSLASYLRRVWVGADRAPTFTGFATDFHDDLVIFLDLQGKTRVLEPVEIRKIGGVEAEGRRPLDHPRAEAQLAFPPEVVPCSTETPAPDAVPPSYVIADTIKLGDYFGKLAEHYRALDGFEERTRVYAHPFMFDQRSRVGLLYFQDMELPIPFYFRISTGRAYRFQSHVVIGNSAHEWLPFVQPGLSVRSDVKSHFFSASFVGSLAALPAGSDAFLLARLAEQNGDAPRLGGSVLPTSSKVDHAYNYLMLLGADYWRLSAAAGPSYLATRVEVPMAERRTLQARKMSPTIRLRYESDRLDLRLLYYRTRLDGPLSEAVSDASQMPSARYALASDAFRLGATLHPIPSVELSLDHVLTLGDYAESASPAPVSLAFLHADTGAMVASDFGRYVTVKAYMRLLYRSYDGAGPVATSRWDPKFGGALEFVF